VDQGSKGVLEDDKDSFLVLRVESVFVMPPPPLLLLRLLRLLRDFVTWILLG
jgi:hypothetical protein